MKKILYCTILTAIISGLLVTASDLYAEKQNATSSKSQTHDPSTLQSAPVSGKVVETMDSGGYTYVCLEKNGKKIWLAVPQMKVTKGSNMQFAPGVEMTNFKSKTLNRTFESIIFSGGPITKQAMAQSKSIQPAEKIKVEKATTPDAYTIAEIYKNKVRLNNKKVTIKGKAVKVSSGIMGRNWLHIQDGSGNAKNGTHDLVVTTTGSVSVGEIVTVSGILMKDKDFGSGYKYTVIIENAEISK